MRYFFKVYGCWHGANEHLSNDPINFNNQSEFHYLAIDQISDITGNTVIMTNGDCYCLNEYNMDKLKEFLYHHDCRFIDTLGHEWRPAQRMTEDR